MRLSLVSGFRRSHRAATLSEGSPEMPPSARELVLIYEPEAACLERLSAQGFTDRHALEISSYLAQSTDIAADFNEIADACDQRGLSFRPLHLDDAPRYLGGADRAHSVIWTLTDGIAYFRGGVGPALAR